MGHVPTYDASGADFLTTAEVRENLDEAIRGSAQFGDNAQTEADKALGQLEDAVADEIGRVYELLQAIVDARIRASAEGVQLDNIGALIGVPREPATASTVELTLTGTPATLIPAGSRARVTDGPIFALDADATIGGGGTVDAAATCTETGASEAVPGAIDEIVDTVSGWTAVTNTLAAVVGAEVELDSVYRRRQVLSLSAGGTARPAAIRANIVELDAVTAAAVIENLTLVTDSRGIPGKSYRPIVWPTGLSTEEEEQIAQAIWEVTPAGIYVDGSNRYTITDDQGYVQEVGFEYGTQLEIYAEVYLTVNSEYPTTGDADVETAMKEYDNSYSLGSKVLPDDLVEYIRDEVPGIDHCDLRIKAGSVPGAADTVPLYPEPDEVAYFATNVNVYS